MSDTFFAVRVLMTGRQKPSNIVVQAANQDLAIQGAHRAYPGLITSVRLVSPVGRLEVLGQLDEFGDVRAEDGAILTLNEDPRFPARAEHLYLFRLKFKDTAGFDFPADREWDTHAVIEADSEDCAWAILNRIFGEHVERVDIDFIRDRSTLDLFITIDRYFDPKVAEWARSLHEMPSTVFHCRNFRTFMAFAGRQMAWDRAAGFWIENFDNRRGPQVPERSFTGTEVANLIDDLLRQTCGGGDPTSFGIMLKARLAA